MIRIAIILTFALALTEAYGQAGGCVNDCGYPTQQQINSLELEALRSCVAGRSAECTQDELDRFDQLQRERDKNFDPPKVFGQPYKVR